jgi:hypothetical protein
MHYLLQQPKEIPLRVGQHSPVRFNSAQPILLSHEDDDVDFDGVFVRLLPFFIWFVVSLSKVTLNPGCWLIKYKTWLLLKAESYWLLTSAEASFHALFGSIMEWTETVYPRQAISTLARLFIKNGYSYLT